MSKNFDLSKKFSNMTIIHHNQPAMTLEEHSHNETEFFFPMHGTMEFEVEGQTFQAGPGKMVVVKPQLKHRFSCNQENGERVILLFPQETWNPDLTQGISIYPVNHLLKHIAFYLMLHPDSQNADSLIDVFTKTFEEIVELGSQTRLFHFDYFLSMARDERIKKALNLMSAHLGEGLSLTDIGERAGLSSRNMTRLFQEEFGLNSQQVLSHVRISRSVELLSSQNYSVTQVALEVGYGSLSHFIKTFEALTGQIPSSVIQKGGL